MLPVKIYILSIGKFSFHVIAKFTYVVLSGFDIVNVFFGPFAWYKNECIEI